MLYKCENAPIILSVLTWCVHVLLSVSNAELNIWTKNCIQIRM